MLRAVFGCAHERTTFPLTPKWGGAMRCPPNQVPLGSTRRGPIASAYVVCLDCGKEFAYDWAQMRVGEPVRHRDPIATDQQVHTFIG